MVNSSDKTKYDDFLRRRDTLLKIIEQQLAILSSLRLTSLEAEFQRIHDDVLADAFKVLVIGEFKRGKSTFINALLGHKILPAKAPPATAIISEVKWGEESRALLHHHRRKDGGPGRIQEVPVNSLEQYILIKNFDQNRAYENPYEKVELFWPLELCKNGIEIIDSPGLNEDVGRQAITLEYLSSVDATIFVVSCDSPVSMTEKSTIDTIIRSGQSRVFFICNRIDVIDDEEQEHIRSYCRSVLGPLTELGESYVFFISARNALKGRESDDPELVRLSGIVGVEVALKNFLATERGRVKQLLPAIRITEVINDVWQDIPNREKMLSIDLATIQARQIQAEKDLQYFEAERNQIVNHLDKFRLKTVRMVESAAENFYRKLSGKIAGWMQNYQIQQPIEASELFSSKARERVAAELTKFLTDQIDRAQKEWQASEIQPQMNVRIDEVGQELEAMTRDFVSGLEQVRFELEKDSDISYLDSRKSVSSGADVEKILSIPEVVATSNINASAFGTIFNFKNMLIGFTPTILIPPFVLLFGWNPLILIPVLLIGIGIILGGGEPALTKMIKENVAREYERNFNDSLPDLVRAVTNDVDRKLMNIENDLDQRLGLKIQNIREQVAAVVLEKEQGQVRVDEAIHELEAIKERLMIIDDEVRTLIREVVE